MLKNESGFIYVYICMSKNESGLMGGGRCAMLGRWLCWSFCCLELLEIFPIDQFQIWYRSRFDVRTMGSNSKG